MVITRMSRRNVQRRFCNVLPVWFPAGETNGRVDQSSARKKPPAVQTQVNELLESTLTHNDFLFLAPVLNGLASKVFFGEIR